MIFLIFYFYLLNLFKSQCEYQNQNITFKQIKSDQINILCSQTKFNNSTILCESDSNNSINFNQLFLNNCNFQCNQLKIYSIQSIVISNVTFGLLNQNKFQQTQLIHTYIHSNHSILISGNIKQLNNYYSFIILDSEQDILIGNTQQTTLTSGRFASHALRNINITNSILDTKFIKCDKEDIHNLYSKQQKDFIQIKTQDDGKTIFQMQNISSLSKQQSNFEYLLEHLKQEYTFLLYSEDSIFLSQSTLYASKAGLFAKNIQLSSQTNLIVSGRGCPAKFGKGKGLFYDTAYKCTPNGAHHAGYGGIGMPLFEKQADIEKNMHFCLKYFQISNFVLDNGPYSYLNQLFQGSGGSCEDYIEEFNELGQQGAGGGVILLYSVDQIVIDGSIQADGMKFEEGGSGGSGGSIGIKSNFIFGKGDLSAVGGDSDRTGLYGEGAGGKIQLNQQNWWNQDLNINQKQQFEGNIIYSKGKREFQKQFNFSNHVLNQFSAKDGIFIPQICPTGYQPNSKGGCSQCQQQQYKNGLNGGCKTVDSSQFSRENYPKKAFQSKFENILDCIDQCNSFKCDPIRFYIKNVISLNGILYLLFYIFVICLGYVSRRLLKMKPKRIDLIPIEYVKYDFDDTLFANQCKQSDIFKYKDLLYHKYRIQIYGSNSVNKNWFIQPQLPENSQSFLDKREFKEFSKSFISSSREYQSQIFMKITKSDDYSICYIDIFNYKKRNQKHFNMAIPSIIYFSGEGSYLKPYYIWNRDHFLNSLFYSANNRDEIQGNSGNSFCSKYNLELENSKKFEIFLTKLNKKAHQLDFENPFFNTIEILVKIVSFIQKQNEQFFTFLGLKIILLVVEVPFNLIGKKQNLQKGNFQQRITMIEDTENIDKITEIIKRIQQIKMFSLQIDVKISLFVYSFQQNINKVRNAIQNELEVSHSLEMFHNSDLTYEEQTRFLNINHKESIEESSLAQSSEIFHNNHQQSEIELQQYQKDQLKDLKKPSSEVQNTTKTEKLYVWTYNVAEYVRYWCFSHKNPKYSKEILFGMLVSFIIIDTCLTSFYLNNIYYSMKDGSDRWEVFFLFWPFPFVNVIVLILELFLLTNNAYGTAKGFFIFNSMSLISFFFSLVCDLCRMDSSKVIIIMKISLLINKLAIQQIGRCCILVFKKLNISKKN